MPRSARRATPARRTFTNGLTPAACMPGPRSPQRPDPQRPGSWTVRVRTAAAGKPASRLPAIGPPTPNHNRAIRHRAASRATPGLRATSQRPETGRSQAPRAGARAHPTPAHRVSIDAGSETSVGRDAHRDRRRRQFPAETRHRGVDTQISGRCNPSILVHRLPIDAGSLYQIEGTDRPPFANYHCLRSQEERRGGIGIRELLS